MFKNGMRAIHPGEVLLEDCIKPTGISVRALSIALHIPYHRMRCIVNGKCALSADTALRLERYFGSVAQGWLVLQATYDLRVAELAIGEQIKQDISPLRQDVRALEGNFQKPEHPVSVEAMNEAIASRAAKPVLLPMFNLPHPGELLREYLGNMTVSYAADLVGVEHGLFSSVLDGTSSVTLDLANRLSEATGTRAAMWLGMQEQYDRWRSSE